MYRYKITLEYIGLGYHGWQRQKESISLQEVIENAIFSFSKEKAILIVAGRTDSGVHAYGQVAHFDLNKFYEPTTLMKSINHFVRPHTIGVVSAEQVDLQFHARFSAKSRHYVYKILNRRSINIINSGFQYWIRDDLDVKKIQQAANFLVGKHDFTSFRASGCQSHSSIKTLDTVNVSRSEDTIEIVISAQSFLYNMVRNIIGSLILVGIGKWEATKIKKILEAKDRKLAGPTAPAYGLYFLRVEY